MSFLHFSIDRFVMSGQMFLQASVVLFILQYISNVSAFNGRCPAGWILSDHSCYKFDTTLRSFPAAQSQCESVGASLTSISSAKENQFVHELSGNSRCWIGLNDIQQEGAFQWMDGTQFRYSWDNDTEEDYGSGYSACTPPSSTGGKRVRYEYCHYAELDYSSWSRAHRNNLEPNDESGIQDCVRLNDKSYWEDFNCRNVLKFICEKEANEEGTLAETRITCPHSFETIIELGLHSKIVHWSETAYLVASLASHINRSHSSGAEFRAGVTWVNYTFEDAHNNIATCNFSITVLEVDTTPPAIVLCPSDVTVTKVTHVPLTINWEPPLATDVSESVKLVSQSHMPGDEFDIGVTDVTFTFTDDSGNTASCLFKICVLEVNTSMIESLFDVKTYQAGKVPGLIAGLYIILGFIGLTLLLLIVMTLFRQKRSSVVGKQSYAKMNGDAEISTGM